MQPFEFFNPVRIVFGPGQLQCVGREAAKLGRKALVVTYKDERPLAAVLQRVCTLLETAGVTAVPFCGITANPTLAQVRSGIEACKACAADLVIGLGGGSAMDAAKVIAAGVRYAGDPWSMIVTRHDQVAAVPPTEALPLLMVPTLPATSSEMNCGAVLTNEETAEKSYVFAACLYPKVSILDPVLTCSLPAYQTACGAADAISHVMESYLNAPDDTPLQDRIMEGVMLTTMENVGKALGEPENVAARAHLQWAAVVAWNGWAQAGADGWAPMHQLGHVLSARHGVTHGASLAIIMCAWMKLLHGHRPDRYVQWAQRVFRIGVEGRPAGEVANEAIARFEAFLRSIGVPTRLSDVGVSAADIDPMTDDVVRISFGPDGRLRSRPSLGRDEIKCIYELAQ